MVKEREKETDTDTERKGRQERDRWQKLNKENKIDFQKKSRRSSSVTFPLYGDRSASLTSSIPVVIGRAEIGILCQCFALSEMDGLENED